MPDTLSLVNEVSRKTIIAPDKAHLAIAFLLDTSKSMAGEPIHSLNQAINACIEQTSLYGQSQDCVDIAVIEFNDSARVVQEFTPLPQLQPIYLSASGRAAMGEGINLAIDKVKERNLFYASMGTPSYKPWIIMITNCTPTDDITYAQLRIKEEERRGTHGKLKFWAVGAPGYNKDVLTSLTHRCIVIDDLNFNSIFEFLNIDMGCNYDQPQLPFLPDNLRPIPLEW